MSAPRCRAAIVLILIALAGPVWAQGYLITDLGTLGGTTAEANAINSAGQITGSASTSSDFHAFIWQGGSFTDVGLPESNGRAISSNGAVAGYFFPDYGSASHAFLFQGGNTTDLGFLPGFTKGNSAVGVNKFSQVVGNGASGSGYSRVIHPWLWQDGIYTDLTLLVGQATVSGINDDGEIVGTQTLPNGGGTSGFILHNGQVTQIGSLGQNHSVGEAINANGDVAGYALASDSTYHAVLYHAGVLNDLGNGGFEESIGLGLNNVGQVVGYVEGASIGWSQHAFVYGPGGIQDLNNLIDSRPGWTLTTANGIDDSGRITGYGTYNGNQRAFLLTPTDQLLRPATPANVVATSQGVHAIKITWDQALRATSYRVKRSVSNTGPFTTIGTVSTTSYTDNKAILHRRGYYYVVSAVNSAGESPDSVAVYAQP